MKEEKNSETLKALLILDLDETLIHSSSVELGRPADFNICGFNVYKRPYLDEFLTKVFNLYRVAIWSTGSDDYVTEIANAILPSGMRYEFIWGRSRCTAKKLSEEEYFYGGVIEYTKPIKKLRKKGYRRERILIVDDSPQKVTDNYGNAIYIDEYLGDSKDLDLKHLINYLIEIEEIPNYRSLEKRGWKS